MEASRVLSCIAKNSAITRKNSVIAGEAPTPRQFITSEVLYQLSYVGLSQSSVANDRCCCRHGGDRRYR
jgi:hypothetical protein